MDNVNQNPSSPIPTTPPVPNNQPLTTPNKKNHMPLLWGFLTAGTIVVILSIFFSLTQNKTQTPKTTTYAPPTATPIPYAFDLSIESPSDNEVTHQNRIAVKGKTSPKSTVVLFSDNDQNSVESDDSGNFTGDVLLASGINSITITAYGENDEEKSQALDVVYDDGSQ